MDQFVWKEIFSIGIDEIDSQHKTLLKCLNECLQKTELTGDEADIHDLLTQLKTYVVIHFQTEEKLMKSVNYPEFEWHRKQHRLLTEQAEQLEKEVHSGKKHVIASLTALLRDWYIQHILEHDKRIGAYVLSRS